MKPFLERDQVGPVALENRSAVKRDRRPDREGLQLIFDEIVLARKKAAAQAVRVRAEAEIQTGRLERRLIEVGHLDDARVNGLEEPL
jgi:hypothetical protein